MGIPIQIPLHVEEITQIKVLIKLVNHLIYRHEISWALLLMIDNIYQAQGIRFDVHALHPHALHTFQPPPHSPTLCMQAVQTSPPSTFPLQAPSLCLTLSKPLNNTISMPWIHETDGVNEPEKIKYRINYIFGPWIFQN